MRGKVCDLPSQTSSQTLRSLTANKGSKTQMIWSDAAGKSQTCRASVWQSHCANSLRRLWEM